MAVFDHASSAAGNVVATMRKAWACGVPEVSVHAFRTVTYAIAKLVSRFLARRFVCTIRPLLSRGAFC